MDDLVINKKLSKQDIINLFLENNIDWDYNNRFNKSIEILKGKESITTIKISDFILEQYKKQLLFLIPQHPTSAIFLNIANQILEKLNIDQLDNEVIEGINDIEVEDSTYHLSSCMFPLHKSAIIDYNLEYGEEYLENSENFYIQRILTYLAMNHNL